MDEYTATEVAYKNGYNDGYAAGFIEGSQQNTPVIDKTSIVEAEPVRHGRWVIVKRRYASDNPYMDDNYFAGANCSECGFCVDSGMVSFGYPKLNTTRYCPNCGAKMDGE